MPMTRAERVSIHKKQERMNVGTGIPVASDLQEGVSVLRSTSGGVIEYLNYGGVLYEKRFSQSTETSVPVKSAFNATATSDQTITVNVADQAITFTATRYNINNDFDVSSNSYIAPVAGIYSFYMQILWKESESDEFDTGEKLNLNIYNSTTSTNIGSDIMEAPFDYDANIFFVRRLHTEAVLAKGDSIIIRVTSVGSGGNMVTYNGTQTNYSYFTGHLISEV